MFMIKQQMCAVAAGALFMAACGGSSDGGGSSDSAATSDPLDTGVEFSEDIDFGEEPLEEVAEELEAVQDSIGGGGATLTANGQTWQFDSVLCAFGEDQIGVAGSVFNLSAIANGLQLYASIDDSGASHTLSINDIENFENPSVSLSVSPFVVAAAGTEPEFLTLDDKTVTAEVVMIDGITGAPTDAPAVLSGTCP